MVHDDGRDVEEHLESDLAHHLAHLAEVGALGQVRACEKVLYQSRADIVSPDVGKSVASASLPGCFVFGATQADLHLFKLLVHLGVVLVVFDELNHQRTVRECEQLRVLA